MRFMRNQKRNLKEDLDRLYPGRSKFQSNQDAVFCFQIFPGGVFKEVAVWQPVYAIAWLDEQAMWNWDGQLKIYRWNDYFKFYMRHEI